MIGVPSRSLAVVGLFFLYLWPRYFFVNVAGKGVSGFTLFAMLLFAQSIFLLTRSGVSRAFLSGARRSGVVLALFAVWWVWRLACDAMGDTPAQSYGQTLLDFVYLGTWLVSGAVLFTDARLRAALLYVIPACGVIATIFGLIELRTGTPLSTVLGFADFQAGDQYSLSIINSEITRGDVVRIRSIFTHPLVYGQVLASMTPVALHFILHGRGARRLIGLVLAGCIVTSVTISNARSPFLVAAAAGAVYFVLFYFDPRRGRRLFVLLWAALGLLIVVPTATGALVDVASGRTSEEAISSTARDRQMSIGKASLQFRPINGYGDGNAGRYAGIVGERGIITVDNYYLTTAVSSGYLGLAIFLLLLLAIVVQGIRLCIRLSDTATRSLACVAVATVVALGMGLTILSIVDTLSFMFLMTGCLIALSGTSNRLPLPRGSRAGPVVSGAYA